MIRLYVFVVCLLLALVGGAFVPFGSSLIVATAARSAPQADPLDINTATAEQLKTLPGIGDVHSERIIKGRPYARKDELVQKKILSRGRYEQIKYKIVAKQQ